MSTAESRKNMTHRLQDSRAISSVETISSATPVDIGFVMETMQKNYTHALERAWAPFLPGNHTPEAYADAFAMATYFYDSMSIFFGVRRLSTMEDERRATFPE